ncbi:hypothetical protein PIB30_013506 [Stylosanthes scabra]|uniref:U1-type domain-containing protein n=1 Tax=Stylosanthes scabra TaxID=79078 RepID=A0ABU6Q6C3_9FABA|nr:hypothetical protein [Stylosanthes scabra]
MDYSAYQQQQQQQQQQAAYTYEYDPSQIQAYDQSYAYQQPYYPYAQQYAYYPDPTQAHLQFQPEPAPVHPPGVNPEPPPQRPAHAPTGTFQYRGRGGRGGRSSRGGGRGQFNRGRGRGHFPSHSSATVVSDGVDVTAAAAGVTLVVQPSSSSPKQAQVPAAPPPPPPPKAWCEICKVGCNTLEVMEQHKNGKKHKKNVKAREELERQKAINEQIPTAQFNLTAQPKTVEEAGNNGGPTEVAAVNQNDETQLQNNLGETSAVSAEDLGGNVRDNTAGRGRGLKRKMRGGRGSKSMRTGLQQALNPPDINALSNAINAQVQQGDNDPQVLLAQLLMNVLSQAQAQAHGQTPGAAPQAGPVAAQMPGAVPSIAGSSYEPLLSQTQALEIPAHVDAPGSQNAGGNFELKQQVLEYPQPGLTAPLSDSSGAANDQIASTSQDQTR